MSIGCVEKKRGAMKRERRFRPFVAVDLLMAEAVAAAPRWRSRRADGWRWLRPRNHSNARIARTPCSASCVTANARQLGLDERGGVERLLVAGARRLLAAAAAAVAGEPERVLVESALVAEPAQRLEPELGELRPAERGSADDQRLR